MTRVAAKRPTVCGLRLRELLSASRLDIVMRDMGTPPVSQATDDRIALLFAPAERERARLILRDECGNNLPACEGSDEGIERIRFAVLKLSAGRLDKLQQKVEAAKIDWRHMLLAAGF